MGEAGFKSSFTSSLIGDGACGDKILAGDFIIFLVLK